VGRLLTVNVGLTRTLIGKIALYTPRSGRVPARPLRVTTLEHESADVLLLTMQSMDGEALPTALIGRYVVLRLRTRSLFHSYSLSVPLSNERYRSA
jgi:ferredoxin-NADP reductase